jgi:hypothetical protein
VSAVGFTTALPMDGTYGAWDSIEAQDLLREADAGRSPLRKLKFVSPGVFRALGTTARRGPRARARRPRP